MSRIQGKLTVAGGFMLLLCCLSLVPCAQNNTGILRISFNHLANGKKLTLRDSSYTNTFGETYRVNKLKYYVGFPQVGDKKVSAKENYFLVNAAKTEDAIELIVPAGEYHSMQFLLGVDSIDNCTGAQTGALDPMNDMFWTWNSGYIFFKLEGTSDASPSDLQRIEHHIGGYKSNQQVATMVKLQTGSKKKIDIKSERITTLIVDVDLDRYWNNVNEIRIAGHPVCMSPGELAKKIAANFPALFSINSISTPGEEH